jgi:hypothetical protein
MTRARLIYLLVMAALLAYFLASTRLPLTFSDGE